MRRSSIFIMILIALAVISTSSGCIRLSDGKLTLGATEGLLVADSVPSGARIFVDGAATNYTTPSSMRLTEGQHRVRFLKVGYYETLVDVDVKYGETTTIEPVLRFDSESFKIDLREESVDGTLSLIYVFPTGALTLGDISKVTYYQSSPEGPIALGEPVEGAPFGIPVDRSALTGTTHITAIAEDAYGHKAQATGLTLYH